MSFHIWLRVAVPRAELQALHAEMPACEFYVGKNPENDAGWVQKIDAVFTDDPLPDELCRNMANLRWLHATRGGVNAYLTSEIRRRAIQVTGSKGIHGAAFSEFAMACLFALAKGLPQCWQAQHDAQWRRFTPEDLEGATLGIVGLGTIGTALAKKAHALGLRVIATKRTVQGKPEFVDEIGGPEYLPLLLKQADFVVLCLASIPSTTNIIGEAELRSMKPSAYLINLTAGKAIEENLLVQALTKGWIRGAALDALPRQPLPEDSALWHLSNVIITPRIAGASAQKWPLLLGIFRENLRRFVAGEPLHNVIDKDLGY